MLTADQVAVLLVAAVGGAAIIGAYLAAIGDPYGRHDARTYGLADDEPEPLFDTVPIAFSRSVVGPEGRHLRPEPRTAPIPSLPPGSGEIPLLLVDGPPSTRGRTPATGLPIEVRPSCSFCRDGVVVISAACCPWCGQGRAR